MHYFEWLSFLNPNLLLEMRISFNILRFLRLKPKNYWSYLHKTTIVTVAFNSSEGCPVLSSRALTVGFWAKHLYTLPLCLGSATNSTIEAIRSPPVCRYSTFLSLVIRGCCSWYCSVRFAFKCSWSSNVSPLVQRKRGRGLEIPVNQMNQIERLKCQRSI